MPDRIHGHTIASWSNYKGNWLQFPKKVLGLGLTAVKLIRHTDLDTLNAIIWQQDENIFIHCVLTMQQQHKMPKCSIVCIRLDSPPKRSEFPFDMNIQDASLSFTLSGSLSLYIHICMCVCVWLYCLWVTLCVCGTTPGSRR